MMSVVANVSEKRGVSIFRVEVTTQKNNINIFIAVRTSDLTRLSSLTAFIFTSEKLAIVCIGNLQSCGCDVEGKNPDAVAGVK
jgi:hypothetical protein